jgi:2,4-dienoyl-CoA reductase-like NADH-dependent reductase (Old Yellow Enzyme family)
MKIKNRFVRSGTYEGLATETGKITEQLLEHYKTLAEGEVGVITTSYAYVHPTGRSGKHQIGLHQDENIDGLKRLVETVHENNSKIIIQLTHSGRQTTKELAGITPIAPSTGSRDPSFFLKPREMTSEEIDNTILDFQKAAKRALMAGVDGIEIEAAGGYLIHQFLSPFFNKRKDEWGGTDENRFKFLKEIILRVKEVLSDEALLVQLTVGCYTPQEGVTKEHYSKYAKWLVNLGIDGLAINSGTISYSPLRTDLGMVPVKELLSAMPWWRRIIAWFVLNNMKGKYDLVEGWNLDAARVLKPILGDVPLIVVGGFRRLGHMEEVVSIGEADMVALSRPLIREPYLVYKFMNGESDRATCVSCNRCFAAILHDIPIKCYVKGLPIQRKDT